jgi:hypothetical protein
MPPKKKTTASATEASPRKGDRVHKASSSPRRSMTNASSELHEDDDAAYHLISQAPFMLTQEDFESYGHKHTQEEALSHFDEASQTNEKPSRKRGRLARQTKRAHAPMNQLEPENVPNFNFDPDLISSFQLEEPNQRHLVPSPRKKTTKRVIHVATSSNPLAEEKPRRMKRLWTPEEEESLKRGVSSYGLGNWAKIRDDPVFVFQDGRTSVDLKDKWRNMTDLKSYKDHDLRKYVLLNEKHEFLLTTTKTGKVSGCHYFQNRWPREAALKVAARDEFYTSPEDSGPIMIYLRETKPHQPSDDKEECVVHVYKGRRERRIAVDIPKFKNKQFMWEPFVIKVRGERLSSGHYAVVPAHELPEELQPQTDFNVQFDGLL